MARISFIGDIMCEHTRLDSFKTETGAYDFIPLFRDLSEEFRKSDVVIANLETPLAGEDLRYSWKDYQFNTPDSLANALKDSGIEVVTTANNHVLDRDFAGLEKTLDVLDSIGIRHTGSARTEEESKPLILCVKGIKIGIISYTYGTEACYNGYYLKSGEEYKVNLLKNQELKNPIRRAFYISKQFLPRVLRLVYRILFPNLAKRSVGELKENDKVQKTRLVRDIAYAKANSDYVVMCLHCGGQFNEKPTKYTREISDFCIHEGVDAVIGNHEHHIQESRMDDPRSIITYCLGNYTSNYGIDRKPYDKNAECSIMLNIYIDEESKSVINIGFEVLISEKNEKGMIVTKSIYECIEKSSGQIRQDLCEKNRRAVNAFLGTAFQEIIPQREYIVSQLSGRTEG